MTNKKRRTYHWHVNYTDSRGVADTKAKAVRAMELISGFSFRNCVISVPRGGAGINLYLERQGQRYGEYLGSIVWVEDEEK